MKSHKNPLWDQYVEHIAKKYGKRYLDSFRYQTECFRLHRIPLEGKRVLDIGGGDGRYSFYMAAAGAREVICLEPELAGSSEGMIASFEETKRQLNLPCVHLVISTFQEYKPDAPFDILFSNASINHLDEEACIHLKHSKQAQEVYRQLFDKMHDMLRPGGYLVIYDASRYCFYSILGLRNPFAPTIEWHKHQTPWFWSRFAQASGFRKVHQKWSHPYRFHRIGHLLIGNPVVNFFWKSQFVIILQRQD